ncbi:MAG: SOS response-associated peptidase [Candidatus Sericytochromatia bacterium]
MCGRFVRKAEADAIAAAFDVDVIKQALAPSFNVAPTQPVQAVVSSGKGTRGLVALKWGLIPAWAKDASGAAKLINARAETAAEKPSFRAALRSRRCLIVASGFYEWTPGNKQPHYIHFPSQELVGFAGLYEFWQSPEGERVASCCMLTTEANPAIGEIHHRMPVLIAPEHRSRWLDRGLQDPAALADLLTAWPATDTDHYPVNPAVNRVVQNEAANLERWAV